MAKKFKKFKPLSDNNRIDTDRDGLTDYEEINIYGTNPVDPDSDKDGMSDGDEVKNGRNPLGSGSLRNLFIPNQSNQYQPKILNPYRLLFYSFSAVVLKVILVGLIVLVPTAAWLTPNVLTAESQKIVQLTNNIRQNLSIPVLQESPSLNQAAFSKAQDMLIQQYFAHVGPDRKNLSSWISAAGYQYDLAGENLAMGFSNASEVVTAWTNSPTHYANLVDPDFKEIGVGMVAGLYQGNDTTLVAQYFAYPRGGITTQAIPTPEPEPVVEPEPEIIPEPTPEPEPVVESEVLGETQPLKPEVEVFLEPEPVVEPEPEIIPEPTPEPEPVVEIIPTPEPVVIKELAQPTLIYPQSDVILGSNKIKIIVNAPEAKKVIVYNNDTQLTSRNSLNSDLFDFEITLVPGENILKFKSIKDLQESFSSGYVFTIDNKPPVVDTEKSTVALVENSGQSEQIVKVVAYLSSDTTQAKALFNKYQINLEKTNKVDEQMNQWVGQMIIFKQDKNKIFDPVTLPVIIASDQFGNQVQTDISWDKVIPIKPSVVKQYLFAKAYPLQYVDLLFDFTQWYYVLILSIAIIALILNIFVEIKKQHLQIIISSLGFISLLVVLIII